MRESEAAAKGFYLRESEAAAATAPMLVTKALSQDVMLLAFVPLLLIPKESPSLHSNQPIYIIDVLTKSSTTTFGDEPDTSTNPKDFHQKNSAKYIAELKVSFFFQTNKLMITDDEMVY
ncbi:hypothetical protein [Lysinibacillus sp. NPDC056232]|uniref:hypothetical protein n=1 Tax=Lysinibacillus sp. NPDC056232 TaxID=3345756 RepID=UPI0035D94F22